MAERYLLDACAIIAYLSDEEGADKVEELLWRSNQGSVKLSMHEVNLLEVYYGVYRDDGMELAEETYERVVNLPIRIIEGLRKSVLKEAGRFKAVYRISLADSIALSVAKVKRIPLVTCDHHEFDRLQEAKELDFVWIR
jgi:predicted nucleic acid-binding protein